MCIYIKQHFAIYRFHSGRCKKNKIRDIYKMIEYHAHELMRLHKMRNELN